MEGFAFQLARDNFCGLKSQLSRLQLHKVVQSDLHLWHSNG